MKPISIIRMRGLSLIELMVALTISAVLIFGATQVYVDSRNAYNVNESVARLQENARYAMSVLEPDVRMANYWGLMKGSGFVTDTDAAAPVASAQNCGTGFAVDVNRFVTGDNNQYQLSPTRPGTCDSVGGSGWATNAMPGSDTLTVRHASIIPMVDGGGKPVTTANVLQVCSTRSLAYLISNGTFAACGSTPDSNVQRVNNLVVNAYYVDINSAQAAGLPSLRRKALTSTGAAGGIKFLDQEVMPGVEDLQVQFGVEPAPPVGKQLVGIPVKYVNPNTVLATDAIVAVRIWLLLRAEQPEAGFKDTRTYVYGDRAVATGTVGLLSTAGSGGKAYRPSSDVTAGFGNMANYRRLLISKTIQLRNSLGT